MNHADYFDGLTETKLRGAGSRKWTTYPDAIGAFIAEMDFGTAPEVQAALQEPVGSAALGYAPVTAVDDMTRACSAWLESIYGWTVPATDIRPIPDVLAASSSPSPTTRHPGRRLSFRLRPTCRS